MDSAVTRVQFDYDLDDLADVSIRYYRSTKMGQVQRRGAIWGVGLGLVVAAILLAALTTKNWSLNFLAPVVAVAIPIAAFVAYRYGTTYDVECRRNARRFLADEIGEGERFTC